MSESVDASSQMMSNPGYISTIQAISNLKEILQNETIDETVTDRILEIFSQTLESSSQNVSEFQTLSIMVSSSEGQVEIIGPEGFEYVSTEVNEKFVPSITGKFIGQLELTPDACPDPADCPPKLRERTRVRIRHSGQSPVIDTIMIESRRDWTMERPVETMDPGDTPTFPNPTAPGGSLTPTSMDPTDTPPTL